MKMSKRSRRPWAIQRHEHQQNMLDRECNRSGVGNLDHLGQALTETTPRVYVSHIGAADICIARSISPGYLHVVCPPFLWLTMCGDVDDNRREIVQASCRIRDQRPKLAVGLSRASSCAGYRGPHDDLSLSFIVPRKASDVEHAVGFLGRASSPHADEVKPEAWVCLKVPNADFGQLVIFPIIWNLEHLIPRRWWVGRS